MSSLFKKKGSKQWQMGVSIGGRQKCKSARTRNKRTARRELARWEAEILKNRSHLPTFTPPHFENWAADFLKRVDHPNTRKRYASSLGKLKKKFKGIRLSEISPESIEEYAEERLAEGAKSATVNHDLRVLRRMMRLAERKQLIGRNPFCAVEFLKQHAPSLPHIVTFAEEEKILQAAPPHIRTLVVLILETGMRSHREALALRWEAIDFANDVIRVRESKTSAGIRSIPLSERCKSELLHWRQTINESPFVFPSLKTPTQQVKDVRGAWASTLEKAGVKYFWLYNLRHSWASRLSAAGVSDLFVAQLLGHASPTILQKYSKAIDVFRRDAIRKLQTLREECSRDEKKSAQSKRESSELHQRMFPTPNRWIN